MTNMVTVTSFFFDKVASPPTTSYNEIGCLENLLQSVSRIHWPTNRLQIQLLDNSTMPETVEIAEDLIDDLWISGFLSVLLILLSGFAEYQTYLTYLMIPALYLGVVWTLIFVTVVYDTKFMHPTMTLWERMRRVYMIPVILMLSIKKNARQGDLSSSSKDTCTAGSKDLSDLDVTEEESESESSFEEWGDVYHA